MTGREYVDIVKRGRCVICLHRLGVNNTPCDAHHVGTGDERDYFSTVSLCKEHHQGETGVHGMHRRAFYRFWRTCDVQLLAWTAREVVRTLGARAAA